MRGDGVIIYGSLKEADLEERCRKTRLGGRVPESEAWRKHAGTRALETDAGKRALAEGCWKARFGGRVPESETWRKGAAKRDLEEGCQKVRLGM